MAGGSGFIGKHLSRLLQKEAYEVAWLSRKSGDSNGIKVFEWNPAKQTMDHSALEWADHLVVLSGAGIADKRWTAKRKRLIINSRVDSARTLQTYLKDYKHQIKTVVTASAVGFYGNRGDEWLDENSGPSDGFLSESTQAWEDASAGYTLYGVNPAIVRIGLVLGRTSGLLREMDKQLRFGIRPIVGTGKQYYPWIHIDDVCSIFIHAIKHQLTGIYNGVAPNPVTQNELLKAMVSARGTVAIPAPAPAFVLKIMLGEMAAAVLSGQRVKAEKIIAEGFQFKFNDLDSALTNLYNKN